MGGGGSHRPARAARWALVLVFAASSLNACTAVSESPGSLLHSARADAGPGGEGPVAAYAPAREFTKDDLYKLLVAEFAARRGQLPLAIGNYLEVARERGEAGAAERAVRFAVYARDELRALEAAELWTELAPDDSEGRQVYAALLIRAGRIDDAVAELETLVAERGELDERGFDAVGDLLSRERDKKAALEAMGRLLTGRETNPHALYAYAILAARAGELGKATELLEQLLALEPGHERAAVLYARLLQQSGDVNRALGSLARTLERSPGAYPVRAAYARLLVDANRYDEARAQFEILTEQEPDNADVRFMLGLLLLETNRPEEARRHFERLLEVPGRRETAQFYLGQIAEALDDDDAALEAYSRVDGGEHYLNAQIRIAVVLAEQDEVDAARSHLHAVPRASPEEDVRLYRVEAEILADQDLLEEAMWVYDQALAEHPEDPDLLYARAMLAERLDRLDVLEQDLRAILAQDPDNADALNALGYTLADRTDRYEEAYRLISRAFELKPNDYYIIDSMGWVLYRMGRHEEALEHLERALAMSDDPEVAAHLGEVLWVIGRKDAAREVWDTALKTTPDDEHLLETIRRFSH